MIAHYGRERRAEARRHGRTESCASSMLGGVREQRARDPPELGIHQCQLRAQDLDALPGCLVKDFRGHVWLIGLAERRLNRPCCGSGHHDHQRRSSVGHRSPAADTHLRRSCQAASPLACRHVLHPSPARGGRIMSTQVSPRKSIHQVCKGEGAGTGSVRRRPPVPYASRGGCRSGFSKAVLRVQALRGFKSSPFVITCV